MTRRVWRPLEDAYRRYVRALEEYGSLGLTMGQIVRAGLVRELEVAPPRRWWYLVPPDGDAAGWRELAAASAAAAKLGDLG